VRVPLCDLRPALNPLRADIERVVAKVLERGWFLRGPESEAFEAEWAAYCGQSHCVACSSGTDALTLAGAALSLRTASVQANTLPLTAQGLSHGAVEITVSEVGSDGRLREVTGNAVPVLLYGRNPNQEELKCRLFDAAHAHGWKPPKDTTVCWSFYPTKNLGALGDAGAVTTDSREIAQRLRALAGPDDQFRDRLQINSRMDELQAGILRVKLKVLDAWNDERRRIAEAYWDGLPDCVKPVSRPSESQNHLFVVLCEKRDEMLKHLEKHGIQAKVHFPKPLHWQDAPWARGAGELPNAEWWCQHVLTLPLYPGLSLENVSLVCQTIRQWQYC
jgi:dTDP-4-amino-4,6-dideoxygalactose transaminase